MHGWSTTGKILKPNHSIALVLMMLGPCVASAAGQSEQLQDVSVAQLKAAYLSCDRAVMAGALKSPHIMQCSVIYEALKRRAFEGDFEKLQAWARSQQNARSVGN